MDKKGKGEDGPLLKVCRDASKMTAEQIKGLSSQVVKALLFNCNPLAAPTQAAGQPDAAAAAGGGGGAAAAAAGSSGAAAPTPSAAAAAAGSGPAGGPQAMET